jgi:hypothetical protein
MSRISGHIPRWGQVIPVYGVIAIVLYAWTLMRWFWQLPSWLYFLNGGEIAGTLAYLLVINFAESLVFICGPLLVALILPKRWFRDVFVARGTALALSTLGCMMVLAEQFNNFRDYPQLDLPVWWVLVAAAGIGVLVYVSGRIALLRKALEAVAERASIFVYVLVPLSLLSGLLVIIRMATL